MKTRSIPLVITLLASVLPLPAALLDSKMLTFVPEALLLVLWLGAGATARDARRSFVLSGGWLVLLSFLVVHAAVALIIGVGLGSLGSFSVIVTTFLFIQLYHLAGDRTSPRLFAQQLAIIYLVHAAFLYAELILRLAGFSSVFVSLFGGATMVTKYKTYNSATFLVLLGLPMSFWGLNGMLLGSQSAGQVMLGATMLFAPWYTWSPFARRSGKACFMIAALGFLLAVNMTSTLILAVVVLLMVYRVPISRLHRKFVQVATPLLVMMSSGILISLFLFRMPNEAAFLVYRTAFIDPVDAFGTMNWFQRLFGLGRYTFLVEYADFGAGMLVNQVGLLFVGMALFALGWLMHAAFTEARCALLRLSTALDPENNRGWIWLAVVNALLLLMFALSLVHYTPAIELGGRQLFALHCAMTYVAVSKLRTERLEAYDQRTGLASAG